MYNTIILYKYVKLHKCSESYETKTLYTTNRYWYYDKPVENGKAVEIQFIEKCQCENVMQLGICNKAFIDAGYQIGQLYEYEEMDSATITYDDFYEICSTSPELSVLSPGYYTGRILPFIRAAVKWVLYERDENCLAELDDLREYYRLLAGLECYNDYRAGLTIDLLSYKSLYDRHWVEKCSLKDCILVQDDKSRMIPC
jgi:hypothetical protein